MMLQRFQNMVKSAGKEDPKLWEAAKGFESMFMNQMMKSMRKSIHESEVTKASTGRKIFTEMLDSEYSKMTASKSPNSIAGLIYRQLLMTRTQDLMNPESADSKPLNIPFSSRENLSLDGNTSSSLGNWKLSEEQLAPIINKAAKKYDIPANLIKSVIKKESDNHPHAVSKVGAKGLMQLMDSTAKDLGVNDVFNPEENVLAGSRYLKNLLNKYNGDETLALAAYNAGPGRVDEYQGVPPFKETQNYVKNVLHHKGFLDEAENKME